MQIQILGPGCPNCNKLFALVEETATKAGVEFTLEKVTDINRIITMGVITPPALVVDGEVKCSGRIPTAEQIAAYFKK